MKEKNKIEIVGDEILIHVDSPKYGQQIIIADKDEFEKLKDHRWRVSWNKCTKSLYAKTHVREANGKWTTLQMHRLTMNATEPKFHIDHKNHNTLDNRKCNLQIVGSRENHQNQSKLANNNSGYMGVSFYKRDKKFQAQITSADGKRLNLGLYHDPYSAALAYVCAKLVIHSNLCSWEIPTCAEGLLTIDAFVAHLETVRDNPCFQRHILSNYGEAEFASALSKIDFTNTKLFDDESLQNYMERRRE